jgi:predicted Rossmann fold flavoprotein
MLLAEMTAAGVELRLNAAAGDIRRDGDGFTLTIGGRPIACGSLVIATGGKSIPKMGATGFGYEVARQFGLAVTETRPALVPLTFEPGLLERLRPLAGVAVPARVTAGKGSFEDGLLFTHRGLSGPAVLQASSYWRGGEAITVDLAPGLDLAAVLRQAKAAAGKRKPSTVLGAHLPARLAELLAAGLEKPLGDTPDAALKALAASANAWTVKPVGSEGYRTAEVTLGGVDTRGLDQKTMQAKAVPGLYFVGEVVDVTGWLGGYNFQWAWASGWAAGQAV